MTVHATFLLHINSMGMPIHSSLSQFFRALGDDKRLLILEMLSERNDQTLFELCARLFEDHAIILSRQGITRHLNTLEQAGLIVTAWRGRIKVHSLTAGLIKETINPWLEPFSEGDEK